MLRKRINAIAVCLLMIGLSGCLAHRPSDCKARGAAYVARKEKLERDAKESLKAGTPREEVLSFFEKNGIKPSFLASGNTGHSLKGTLHVIGCAPLGCGTNDAFIGLEVPLDAAYRVIGNPIVGGFYTNCL